MRGVQVGEFSDVVANPSPVGNLQEISFRVDPQKQLNALLDDPNRQSPPEIVNKYKTFWNNLSVEKQEELTDLFKTTVPSPDPITFPDPDYHSSSSVGPEYSSLRGKLQASYADHVFKPMYNNLHNINLDDPDSVNRFIQSNNFERRDFYNLEGALKEIKDSGGKIDPFNADQLKIRDILMERQGIDPNEAENVVNTTYMYVKKATPAINFHPTSSDYINHESGVYMPKDLDKWFDSLEKTV